MGASQWVRKHYGVQARIVNGLPFKVLIGGHLLATEASASLNLQLARCFRNASKATSSAFLISGKVSRMN
jgi:hypothetical protein